MSGSYFSVFDFESLYRDLILVFWDLESLFSDSPNKAVDKSVDLLFEMINFDRPKEVTIDLY